MVFNATFNTISVLYRSGQFHWWMNPKYLEKTTCPVATHRKTLSHNVVWTTPRLSGIRTVNSDIH